MFTHANSPKLRKLSALLLIAVFLSGCVSLPRPLAEPSVATSTADSVKATMNEGSASSMDIDAGYTPEDLFMLRPINESGAVPDRQVKNVTITESGVFDALRLIAKDAGLTLNIGGGINGSERFGSTSAFDVRGSLKDVLEELSDTMGFFYSVRKNTLVIEQEQQFVVELPPALNEENATDLTNTLQYLGAKEPYIDRMGRSLVFKANRKALAKIEGYLKKIRDTRSLIVYDINIFQVDLKDNSDTGVQWNKLAWNGTPLTTTQGTCSTCSGGVAGAIGNAVAATSSSLGMGLVLSGSKFSIESLINFLQTQGSVKAVSRPRLALISGTKGMLRVGQVTTFISKVGTNFSTSLNQVTTETKDLKTGMELGLFGDFSDNTVYTRVGLMISEITRVDKVQALGTDFTLPQTADRELNTIIRARPGDMILLGGITIERNALNANGGITGAGKSKEVTRSELVLTLKAKVVYFHGKDDKTGQRRAAVAPDLIGVEVPKAPIVQAQPVVAKAAQTPPAIALPAPKPVAPVVISAGSYSDLKKQVTQ